MFIPLTNEAALEEIAKRAAALMFKAKLHVSTYHPFYGALISRMKLKADWRHKTMYTDAVVIGYNPVFVIKQPWNDILYIFAHEATHCALGHPFRLSVLRRRYAVTLGVKVARRVVGIAADHVVNLILNREPEMKKICPKTAYCDPRFTGMAVEQVAAIMYTEELARQQRLREQHLLEIEQERSQQPQQPNDDDEEAQQAAGGDDDDDEELGDDDQSGNDDTDAEEADDTSDDGKSESDETADAKDEGGGAVEDNAKDDKSEEDKDDKSDAKTEDDEDKSGVEDEDDEDSSDAEDDEDGVLENAGATDEPGDCLDAGASGEMLDDDGEPIADPDQAQLDKLQKEWEEATTTAQLAAGSDMGSDMRRAVGKARETNKSLQEHVDEFVDGCLPRETDWGRRNRRHEMYLPGKRPGIGGLAVVADTSASINDDDIALMEELENRIMDTFHPEFIINIYCDEQVRGVERFEYGEYVSLENARGGEGTRFHPAFRKVLELIEQGDQIAGVIYLSDLDGQLMDVEDFMHLKVLWVQTSRYKWAKTQPPEGLGQVIMLD